MFHLFLVWDFMRLQSLRNMQWAPQYFRSRYDAANYFTWCFAGFDTLIASFFPKGNAHGDAIFDKCFLTLAYSFGFRFVMFNFVFLSLTFDWLRLRIRYGGVRWAVAVQCPRCDGWASTECKCCTEVHGCHLADVGPPLFSNLLTCGQLTCWVAIFEVQIILNVRPCVWCNLHAWESSWASSSTEMVTLKVFSTFCCCHGHLTEWLTGARCCSWCIGWFVFFLFWSLCFAFLTDISGFVKTIICFSQPFSGPSILGWRSSTQPSWHTGVSQCIDIWLGLCSICTALHGVHWDVQTAWATQPACTSSAGLFPKRGRKAMALTSKHRVRSFFFQFFSNCEIKWW